LRVVSARSKKHALVLRPASLIMTHGSNSTAKSLSIYFGIEFHSTFKAWSLFHTTFCAKLLDTTLFGSCLSRASRLVSATYVKRLINR
jgi:hypothetical protein